jgi:NAD(P)H-flavin reductase
MAVSCSVVGSEVTRPVAPQARVRLVARAPAGGDMTLVTSEPSPDLVAKYTRPGQVLVVKEPEEAYFALAAPPGAPQWALLVRDAGASARHLVTAPLGASLPAHVPDFAGFSRPLAAPGAVLLVAVGSALGAVRGVYLALSEAGRANDVTLVLGVRTRALVPLEGELASLAREGARIVVCLSDEPAAPLAPFEVRDGLVQPAVEAELAAARGRYAAVLVAGPKAMMDDFRAREADLGVPVLANA